MIRRIDEYYRSDQGRSKYAKHPPGWLSEGKYFDPPESWREKKQGSGWKENDDQVTEASSQRGMLG